VAIVFTTLSLGTGAQAQSLIESQLGEITSVIATSFESQDKASKRRSWLSIEQVGMALPTDQDHHRVTLFGFLPTPCHGLGWAIPSEASADGVLHIEAWSIDSDTSASRRSNPFKQSCPFASDPMRWWQSTA
jgi:hypothetical protein